MSTPELPVLACPWCGYGIGLAAFAPADEEPGAGRRGTIARWRG